MKKGIRGLVPAIAALSAAFALKAVAVTTPVELSLICPPLSIPWCKDVSGLRLDLLSGINEKVYGLDIGTLANIAESDALGLEICGFYNRVHRGVGLVQFAGLMNRCDDDYRGMQAAAIYNDVGGMMSGVALAAMNVTKELHGLQIGVFNTTDRLVGMQLGLVNFAEDSERGVQVGLVNIMPMARLPVNVIVNIGF